MFDTELYGSRGEGHLAFVSFAAFYSIPSGGIAQGGWIADLVRCDSKCWLLGSR